jgi:hypothetical protein
MNRLHAGYCKVLNPYNGKISVLSLRPADVDGFIFWTKNAGPLLPSLSEITQLGFPFYFQYTINGYPRELESSVTDKHRSIEHARQIRAAYGRDALVWRYDTVLFSSLTPAEFHLANFKEIASAMEGVTNEVVISFAQIYAKTKRNLDAASAHHGFRWFDPPGPEKFALCVELTQIAHRFGMQLSVCSQRDFLVPGATAARCVDAERRSRIAGQPVRAVLKGNRPQCECYESRDIGEYDTCPHGCVYCYAVRDRKLAQVHFHEHDPEGELLFTSTSSSRSESGLFFQSS